MRPKKNFWKCGDCGVALKRKQVRCRDCHDKRHPDMTIEESAYGNKGWPNTYARIRDKAKYVVKHLGWSCCQNCGYDKHFEICHIKAIKDFPKDTLLSVVNDPSNLIPLCPNCHWEFDRGILKWEGWDSNPRSRSGQL